MGQYWQLVNLDKMESWDGEFWLKMGDFFLSVPELLKCLVGLPNTVDGQGFVGRWAGDRIICVGDYAHDLPPGIITEDDLPLLEKLLVPESDHDHEMDEGICQDYDGPALAARLYGKGTSIADSLYRPYSPSQPELFPENTVWALRNLSKKEFVCSDKVIRGTQYWDEASNEAFYDVPGLFQVLVMRTGWSSDPSCDIVYNDGDYVLPNGRKKALLNEGAWAGDRLDIVKLTDHGARLKDEGWSDVSEEAFTQMRDIFLSEGSLF